MHQKRDEDWYTPDAFRFFNMAEDLNWGEKGFSVEVKRIIIINMCKNSLKDSSHTAISGMSGEDGA
jgi:hypothetical protein